VIGRVIQQVNGFANLVGKPSSGLEGVQPRLRTSHILFDRSSAHSDATHDFVSDFDR
jgi:hypothetical protein